MRKIVMGLMLAAALLVRAEEAGIRIRFGLQDKAPTVWDGTVEVEGGKITALSGWRFQGQDHTDGLRGWVARTTHEQLQRRSNNAKKAGKRAAGSTGPMADNGVLISLADISQASIVKVQTKQGEFSFKLGEAAYGNVVKELKGAVEIEQVASFAALAETTMDDDYPSATVTADGTVFVAFQSFTPGLDRNERAKAYEKEPDDLKFLAKAPGGDQLFVRAVRGPGAGAALAATEPGRDIYKSALATDGAGRVWIFWAENAGYQPYPNNPLPNFDIYARSLKDGKLSKVIKLSESKENDVWPVAATDAKGRVWVAWQGSRQGVFKIFERHQDGDGWSVEREVSTQSRNCWAPAIATTSAKNGGHIAIAWDTYDKGDYDVWLREFNADGHPCTAQPAANSPDYEARPAITYDSEGALWVAWEHSGPTWAKDWGAYAKTGFPIYRDRQIGLAVLKDGKWMKPEGDLADALPGPGFLAKHKRINNVRVPPVEAGGESRKAGQEAEAQKNNPHNNIARITCDAEGHIWVFARSRQNDFHGPVGSLWLSWGAFYDGAKWVGPILLPHSDDLMYNSPAVVPLKDGSVFVAHASDHRQDRFVQHGKGGNASLDADRDPFINDIFVSTVQVSAQPVGMKMKPSDNPPTENAQPSEATKEERAALARCQNYRLNDNGVELHIVRGEFHRHTEISGDGANDGPLEDMWRYSIDVAHMDWLGCGDHDNGGGREYSWWLTQKTTDAFYLPGVFSGMFSYERSVKYPEGHRNCVFANRGVRTLPRLPISDANVETHAPDTQMLYKYLHLFDGVCAEHTSATDMGTDWRDNDPAVEPMVEIYQGCRQNYEYPGAPRCPSEGDAIGGWRPKGFVNLAFAKGYKFGFESSSDHGSTHISYAMVLAKNNTREEIVKAMKLRHTYAATDNIVADWRAIADGQDHIQGDAFTTSEAPKFKLKLEGTVPFAKVTIIKDSKEVKVLEPKTANVDLEWNDPDWQPGTTHYYYVRGEESDAEKQLVWISPIWITAQPK